MVSLFFMILELLRWSVFGEYYSQVRPRLMFHAYSFPANFPFFAIFAGFTVEGDTKTLYMQSVLKYSNIQDNEKLKWLANSL